MDISKFLQWATEHFSDYFSVFVSTLLRPTARFHLITTPAESPQLISSTKPSTSSIELKLNPRLFGFLVISVFIGATFGSLTTEQSTFPLSIVTTAIVTIVFWIGYGSLTHGICKIIGGKGTFWETLSIGLQLLAVTYVVSNFVTLAWTTVARMLPAASFALIKSRNEVVALLILVPSAFFYLVQSTLMFVYLPLALKYVHRFGLLRQLIITVIPIVGALLTTAFFLQMPGVSSIVSIIVYPAPILTPTIAQSQTQSSVSSITPSPISSQTSVAVSPLLDVFPNIDGGEAFVFVSSSEGGSLTDQFVEACAQSGSYGLQLTYDFTEGVYYGVWGISWNRTPYDASGFSALAFWVKGTTGGETFEIGITDTHNSDDGSKPTVNLKSLVGVSSSSWKMVTVPLTRFIGEDTSSIRAITFVFDGRSGSGSVCIDNIEFVR